VSEQADRGREEFLSEAQDIIEAFSRNLLSLDAAFKKGSVEPGLLNEGFRAIHTLKGLAALFGVTGLAMLTHKLEDLLDALRLGRLSLSSEVLDVLFGAVEACHLMLAAERDDEDDAVVPDVVHRLLGQIAVLGRAELAAPADDFAIDAGILAVLTEYEEHRLRANLDAGMRLYRLRVQFNLLTIDRELQLLKDRARQLGEVITYLPTGESTAADALELDLILASGEELSLLVGQLGGDAAKIEEIPRKLGEKVAPSRPQAAQSHGVSAPLSVSSQSSAAPASSRAPAALERNPNEKRLARRAVRVDIHKLDRLMNVVGELSLIRSSLRRMAERVKNTGQRQLGGEIQRLHRNFERRLEDIQDGILEMRMVPLGQVFDRLARGVRQMSREVGKEVRLVITGAETEIDKLIVEELGDPLLHMLRNAIDHGIETELDRVKAKKNPVGTIALNAYQKGNHVMIEVEDDGRGVNEKRLVERAVELGALERERVHDISRDELMGLMFLPGLSTRDDVSELSGRGVGMDVVKTNIARLGGVIDVQSEPGIGTKLTLTLPITLAIVRALLVSVEHHVFAVPLSSVSEVVALDGQTRMMDGREVTSLRGSTLALCRLGEFFGIRGAEARSRAFVVVAQIGERRLGLVIDSVAGQQDIVIKALGPSLEGVRGFAGATELGDQRVGLVLDTTGIVEEVLSIHDTLRKAVLHA
jgi:two-component system chemotaxis sensor kinase CheA